MPHVVGIKVQPYDLSGRVDLPGRVDREGDGEGSAWEINRGEAWLIRGRWAKPKQQVKRDHGKDSESPHLF